MKDTNPDHYKVDGADFIRFMVDPLIKGFGDWMFANGYNTGELSANRWISVKDRLPEKCERYLCWFGGNKCAVGAEIETYLPDLHGFGSLERNEVYPNITHWMPLPEPPLQGNRSTLSS